MTKTVGIDLSLTSTGLATINGDTWSANIHVDRVRTKPTTNDLPARRLRMLTIVDTIADWTRHADLVVIEGLAYASASPHATERAGLWWLVVDHLVGCDLEVAVVPPSSRAKYATGKGNAGKDAVLAAVIRRYPDVDVTGNDEADALILAAMGARRLGAPIDDLPAAHVAAMAGARWPDLEEVAA